MNFDSMMLCSENATFGRINQQREQIISVQEQTSKKFVTNIKCKSKYTVRSNNCF